MFLHEYIRKPGYMDDFLRKVHVTKIRKLQQNNYKEGNEENYASAISSEKVKANDIVNETLSNLKKRYSSSIHTAPELSGRRLPLFFFFFFTQLQQRGHQILK